MQKFQKIRHEKMHCRSNELRTDTNDCVVKALAIVGRMTYKKAHAIAKSYGRKHGQGMYSSTWVPMFKAQGLEFTEIKRQRQKNGSAWTPKTVGQVTKNGYFLALVRGHVIAIHNGVIQDWTDGRRHHITKIWKITKTRKTNDVFFSFKEGK